MSLWARGGLRMLVAPIMESEAGALRKVLVQWCNAVKPRGTSLHPAI